jgi:hypothetical protein
VQNTFFIKRREFKYKEVTLGQTQSAKQTTNKVTYEPKKSMKKENPTPQPHITRTRSIAC